MSNTPINKLHTYGLASLHGAKPSRRQYTEEQLIQAVEMVTSKIVKTSETTGYITSEAMGDILGSAALRGAVKRRMRITLQYAPYPIQKNVHWFQFRYGVWRGL